MQVREPYWSAKVSTGRSGCCTLVLHSVRSLSVRTFGSRLALASGPASCRGPAGDSSRRTANTVQLLARLFDATSWPAGFIISLILVIYGVRDVMCPRCALIGVMFSHEVRWPARRAQNCQAVKASSHEQRHQGLSPALSAPRRAASPGARHGSFS